MIIFFVLILYTLWNFWIQNCSKLRTHNRNPGSRPLCNRRRFANPTKGVSLGGGNEADLHFSPTYKESPKKGTPSINLFWTTNTVPESNLVRRQIGGEGPRAWRMWRSRRGWGTPDTALVLCRVSSIRQNQFKGVTAGKVLTTKILFFCVL